MSTTKNRRKQLAGKHELRPSHGASPLELNPALLPLEELRQLVWRIILRDDIEPFVRRMVILLDSLKAGQTGKVAQVARQSKDPAFARLMSALSDAVEDGELVAARITVLLAAGYAHQESLDYLWELNSYLDRFRKNANQQNRNSAPTARPSRVP